MRLRTPWPAKPPPGPFRPGFWRSPLRGPWLTSVFGLLLLIGLPLVMLTGFLSYAAYNPGLGVGNSFIGDPGPLDFFLFSWPTHPSWLYALNQGVHVTLGIVLVPTLLAKLWSVIPKLFEWPPLRSPAHLLERLSLALLVGGVLFEFVTGILNVQVFYPWHFSFLTAHYYGAWVFTGAFVFHTAIKLPVMRRQLRERKLLAPLRESLAETRPEPRIDEHSVVALDPSPPTLTRRGVMAIVGGSTLALAITTAGQSIGGPLRRLAILAPRGGAIGNGPNDFPVNKTFAVSHIQPRAVGPGWQLELIAPGQPPVSFSRAALLAMEQHTHELPIACVEGWSTTQTWSGVPLRELAALAGAPRAGQVLVESLQPTGSFRHATLSSGEIADERSLLALRVNGVDLSPDHGFPARVIVPAAPGVHCTKWVERMTFAA